VYAEANMGHPSKTQAVVTRRSSAGFPTGFDFKVAVTRALYTAVIVTEGVFILLSEPPSRRKT
jgi:hypothetical protein